MNRHRLGALDLVSLQPDELFEVVEPSLRHVVTVNAEIFVLAHETPLYQEILRESVNTIDGQPLRWLVAWFNRGTHPRRLAGSDLIYSLAAFCRQRHHRLFLLGGDDRTNALAREQLRARFPGLEVEGFAPPMTNDVTGSEWNAEILTRLETCRPEYLIVVLGPPKADFWIRHSRAALSRLGVRFAAGFGGAMDFVAGVMPRAPRWVQLAGFEWLFRLAREPRGRFRRTLRMFRMPWHVLKYHVLRVS